MAHDEEIFWKELPGATAHARALWRRSQTQSASRIEFEDTLFRLRRSAAALQLPAVVELLSLLEAFVVSVPLGPAPVEAASPGVEAGLSLLEAMCHRNVAIHRPALERMLSRLSTGIAATRPEPEPPLPTFVPPTRPSTT